MDTPDFDTPLAEQLTELKISPNVNLGEADDETAAYDTLDADERDFDGEELPLDEDLGETDDAHNFDVGVFEEKIKRDISSEYAALSQISDLEETGEADAKVLMKDAATEEKYEGLDMQRKVKKVEDKKATNPFELGENDEDSELEEDSEEDSEEGFDGGKFTDGKAGSERFNEGLLADSLHVEAEVERKVSTKIDEIALNTYAKMAKDADLLTKFANDKSSDPAVAKYAAITAKTVKEAEKKLDAALAHKPENKIEESLLTETKRLATDESASKAQKDDQAIEAQAKELDGIEKGAASYVKKIQQGMAPIIKN